MDSEIGVDCEVSTVDEMIDVVKVGAMKVLKSDAVEVDIVDDIEVMMVSVMGVIKGLDCDFDVEEGMDVVEQGF